MIGAPQRVVLNDHDSSDTVGPMYAVCAPPPDLAPYVRLFWAAAAEPGASPTVERVIADGCCELIVHAGAPYLELGAQPDAAPQPAALLYGQLQRALRIAPTGHVDLVAVRFTPAGVCALFGIDVRALASSPVALDSLFGAQGRILVDQVAEQTSRPARFAVLTRFLRARLRSPVSRAALVAQELAAQLDRRVHADAIAQQLGMSWRSLERAFATAVGLAPRQFVQIRRISDAASELRSGPAGLAELADRFGFADQAHFTRAFHALVGLSPGRYLQEVRADPLTIVPA